MYNWPVVYSTKYLIDKLSFLSKVIEANIVVKENILAADRSIEILLLC